MAKRRRVGNPLALAILAGLIQKPMHPYEMASVLRERGKDQDMKIKWGSLYTVVRNLEKHELIEATERARQGGRPERTVYQITEAGRAELVDWVSELIAIPEPEPTRFKSALSVIGVLTPEVGIRLLQQRLDRLEHSITAQRESLAATATEIPRMFLIEDEYDLALRTAEATWLRGVVAEITSGTFPMIELWYAFHATGEVPPELKEIAERGSVKD